MDPKVKNDIYDMMDLLDKLYALPFLKDKERFNEMQDAMIRLTKDQKTAPSEVAAAAPEDDITIEVLRGLLEKMKKFRKKAQLTEFAEEIGIKIDAKYAKYTMDAMRGLILLELLKNSLPASSPKGKAKSGGQKKSEEEKKDFMDRWLDFYKKNRERR